MPLVTLMGLYDSGLLRSPFPLYSAVTLASRHACGVTACRHEKLNTVASDDHSDGPP